MLTTLGERLQEGEATDLAGSLPMEIDWYLESADHGQRFDFQEFIWRVAERQRMDPDDEDWDDLFELVGADEAAFGIEEQQPERDRDQ